MARDPRLKRFGLSDFNKPKRTPNHKTKSHVVLAKVGSKVKLIRFGQQGAKTAGKPKKGESKATRLRGKVLRRDIVRTLKNLENSVRVGGQIKSNGKKNKT